MSGKKQGRTPIFEESLKIAIAREYLSGNLSYAQLATKYNIGKARTIVFFVKWYKENYPSPEPAAMMPERPEAPVAESELELLRRQLKEAQLKVAGYEIMMTVARDELGIDIPKKFGTKQSKK